MDTLQEQFPVPATASRLAAADQLAQQQSEAPPVLDGAEPCPLLKRFVIEACVVGDDGKPLMNVAVQLMKNAGAVLRSKTGLDGVARFERLEAGSYQLGLYQLDSEAWELAAAEALAPDDNLSQGEAEWGVPQSAGQDEEFVHRVRQGECTAKLADRYGFFAGTVWDWPKNAQLKQLRQDKNILNPGDEIVIPAKRQTSIAAQTGMRYRLRRLGIPELLQICFVEEDLPRGDVPYLISFQTQDGTVLCNRMGRTDAAGMLVESVPPSITFAEVTLSDSLGEEVFQFNIGTVDSIDSDSGMLSRLHNLRFGSDQDDAEAGDLAGALIEFQTFYGLNPTGIADDDTRAKLREVTLC